MRYGRVADWLLTMTALTVSQVSAEEATEKPVSAVLDSPRRMCFAP